MKVGLVKAAARNGKPQDSCMIGPVFVQITYIMAAGAVKPEHGPSQAH